MYLEAAERKGKTTGKTKGTRASMPQSEPPEPPQAWQPPKVAVITCAVLETEVAALAKDLPQVVHVELLPQGLHNTPALLRTTLQEAVNRVEAMAVGAEVIALGYGLCSRGVEGVVGRRCTLVMARAHDCITLLLGNRRRYADYVARHPGTYWYSPGWNRHHVPPGKARYDLLRRQYVQQYGEDNADFLMESEQAWFRSYERATYVDLGVGDTKEEEAFTRECARWLGWSFDRQRGSPKLLRDLLAGPWDDERFLVLPPGHTPQLCADDRVVEGRRVGPGELA
jgi:hypothetical protein